MNFNHPIQDKFGQPIWGSLNGGGNPTRTAFSGNNWVNPNVQDYITPIPLNYRNYNVRPQYQSTPQNSPDSDWVQHLQKLQKFHNFIQYLRSMSQTT